MDIKLNNNKKYNINDEILFDKSKHNQKIQLVSDTDTDTDIDTEKKISWLSGT